MLLVVRLLLDDHDVRSHLYGKTVCDAVAWVENSGLKSECADCHRVTMRLENGRVPWDFRPRPLPSTTTISLCFHCSRCEMRLDLWPSRTSAHPVKLPINSNGRAQHAERKLTEHISYHAQHLPYSFFISARASFEHCAQNVMPASIVSGCPTE